MAARGKILVLIVVCSAIFPLLASAAPSIFGPDYTELQIRKDRDNDHNSPSLFDDDEEEDDEDFLKDEKRKRSKDEKRKKGDKEGKKKGSKKKEGKKKKEKKPRQEPVEPEKGPAPVKKGLRVGFYEQSCPQAERIIQETMDKIFERNVKIAPALVRLFFHDCFVTGCDASVLLERTPGGEQVEREAPQNGRFIRGLDEIEEVKAALEAECPGIVSCADTLAFATREALAQTGVPRYPLPAGRRDRPVSLAANTEGNLPFPDTSAQEMIQVFIKKGMTLEDLVVLIGAHSIGEAHCTVYANRFQDPAKREDINPRYLDQLHVHTLCVDEDQTLPFDKMSNNIMDAGFYKQLLAHEALIESDHNLAINPNANGIMKRYADDQEGWLAAFTRSIIKLGEVEVLTGDEGEIRKQCRAFN